MPASLPADPSFGPCSIAAALAAKAAGVPLDELLHAERGCRDNAAARALAMYLAHVGLGVPMSRVARGFNRHRSTVAYACRRIEERREVAGWDRWVDALEEDARCAAKRSARHDA